MQVYFLKQKHILIFSKVPRDLLGSTETSCIRSPLKHIKPKGTKTLSSSKKPGVIKMAALRFIVNIEPNNQNFIQFWEPVSFPCRHRHPSCAHPFHSDSKANCAAGLLWVEMANRWVPTLVCTWVLLGNFRWIQRSLESEPWQDGMLKLQDKKQTNLTPTLHDGSDNCETEKRKKKKEEITEGLIGKSILLCNIVLYPSVKWGD